MNCAMMVISSVVMVVVRHVWLRSIGSAQRKWGAKVPVARSVEMELVSMQNLVMTGIRCLMMAVIIFAKWKSDGFVRHQKLENCLFALP
eukprot:TRINITY_DN100266_c0_g1_i1.p2 TRINITY_DN100266_c0_g1~~TRINITY_DN100266_c0_g1_i1.p2  ORF type:complete len:101 (+),score=7.78 TRINITY_DN100266_c0_g1_i1:38-304(+)